MNKTKVLASLGLALGAIGGAHAGCGLTVTFDNDLGSDITVLLVESKPTGGTYESVLKKNFTVGSGQKVVKAIETTVGCAAPQNLRVKYQKGSDTLYVSKGPLVTAVDKKISVEFDD